MLVKNAVKHECYWYRVLGKKKSFCQRICSEKCLPALTVVKKNTIPSLLLQLQWWNHQTGA